jgi:hypothetical protein
MENAGSVIPQERLQGMNSKQGASAINQCGSHRADAAQAAGQRRLPCTADGEGLVLSVQVA